MEQSFDISDEMGAFLPVSKYTRMNTTAVLVGRPGGFSPHLSRLPHYCNRLVLFYEADYQVVFGPKCP